MNRKTKYDWAALEEIYVKGPIESVTEFLKLLNLNPQTSKTTGWKEERAAYQTQNLLSPGKSDNPSIREKHRQLTEITERIFSEVERGLTRERGRRVKVKCPGCGNDFTTTVKTTAFTIGDVDKLSRLLLLLWGEPDSRPDLGRFDVSGKSPREVLLILCKKVLHWAGVAKINIRIYVDDEELKSKTY